MHELIKELKFLPVQEVSTAITEFVDDILEKTVSINQDRLKLHDQLAPYVSSFNMPSTINGMVADMQESLRLQSELLEIYQEITPINQRQSSTQMVSNENNQTLESVQQRIKDLHEQLQRVNEVKVDISSPTTSSFRWPSGLFAMFSLIMWALGIVTSLMVAEFMSTSEWALQSGWSSANSAIIY